MALSFLVAAAPAHAGDALAQARAAMAQASFEKALSIADKALKTTRDANRRGQLELVRAECFHALRKTNQMKDALEEALRADPLAAFDADSANPELLAGLEQQRKALAGTLIISGSFSNSDAPQVTMDEVKLGRAPVNTRADVGRHRIKLAWPNGQSQEETVTIRAEAESTLVLSRPGTAAQASDAPKKDEAHDEGLAPMNDDDSTPIVSATRPARAEKPRWPWAAVGGGAALTLAGIICLGVAAAHYRTLESGALMVGREGAMAYAAQGQANQLAGIVLTIVGLLFGGVGALGLIL